MPRLPRFHFAILIATLLLLPGIEAHAQATPQEVRVGIIGLDTSHSTAFTKILNDAQAASDVAGFRVVAAYPKGSPDIASSVSRIPQ